MREGRRALITGITGQDGSFLAELLLEKGYEVTGMQHAGATSLGASEHLRARASRCSTASCSSRLRCERRSRRRRPDELYHLAAPSFVPASWESPGAGDRRDRRRDRGGARDGARARPRDPRVRPRLGSDLRRRPGESAERAHTALPAEPVRDREARRAPARRSDARARRPARELGDRLQPRVRAAPRAVRHAAHHARGGGDLARPGERADARLARRRCATGRSRATSCAAPG